MQIPIALLLAASLGALVLPSSAGSFPAAHGSSRARANEPTPDVAALFMAHCASCHGETGDGKGWTELDRPARSFKDGGFSFGNTPETIERTIAGGIPGTPMPGFDSALSEAERALLARYVISLGPPELPAPERTEMIVAERPLVVRGKLPPIERGAPERPRGLLVGTLDGLTFEYDAADVRLLGVRQGRFVDRRDWGDRGGSALAPLGKPVYVVEQGKPRAPFAWRAGEGEAFEDVRASLAGTRVLEGRATVVQTLRAADGRIVARLEESPRQIVAQSGSGFVLTYSIEPFERGELLVRFPMTDPAEPAMTRRFRSDPADPSDPESLVKEGRTVGPNASCLLFVRYPREAYAQRRVRLMEDGSGASVQLLEGRAARLDVVSLLLHGADSPIESPRAILEGDLDR